MSELRARILRHLAASLDGHDATCPPGMCVHTDAAALKPVVDLHRPNARRGSEDTCAGCTIPDVATRWIGRCPTLTAIGAALGTEEVAGCTCVTMERIREAEASCPRDTDPSARCLCVPLAVVEDERRRCVVHGRVGAA